MSHFVLLTLTANTRHGYEILFMERRVALEILFKHLPSKKKVITGRRVIRVDQLVDKVRLYTNDGSQYEADMVIGADGIHSTLRHEIWRMAADLDPSFATEAEDKGESWSIFPNNQWC